MNTRIESNGTLVGPTPVELPRIGRPSYGVLAPLYLAAIVGVPGALVGLLILGAEGVVQTVLASVLAAPLFAVGYGLTAGAIAAGYRSAIVPGKLARDLTSTEYGARRLYGLCWTAVYYAKPVYFLFLAVPCLKRALLRSFGYAGSLDFTTYPDTWVRDLPLLDIGAGVYVSNRATLGTNIVLSSGEILVDRITLRPGALVGHLCMVGPGSRLGERAEMGVGSAMGIRSRLGDGAKLGPQATLEHGVTVGAGTVIGLRSVLGSGARIGSDLAIPAATVVPARTVLRTQEDVDALVRGEGVMRRRRA